MEFDQRATIYKAAFKAFLTSWATRTSLLQAQTLYNGTSHILNILIFYN